jgi:uncharacterized protein
MVLAEIEERTGRPAAERFDLIVGTSTGGILALGLTMPDDGKPSNAAEKLIGLYEEEGSRIFSDRAGPIRSVFEERYPYRGVEEALGEYFGEVRLKEALTWVFVTSYEIQLRAPFFRCPSGLKGKDDYDFPMRQVARATSAAPLL